MKDGQQKTPISVRPKLQPRKNEHPDGPSRSTGYDYDDDFEDDFEDVSPLPSVTPEKSQPEIHHLAVSPSAYDYEDDFDDFEPESSQPADILLASTEVEQDDGEEEATEESEESVQMLSLERWNRLKLFVSFEVSSLLDWSVSVPPPSADSSKFDFKSIQVPDVEFTSSEVQTVPVSYADKWTLIPPGFSSNSTASGSTVDSIGKVATGSLIETYSGLKRFVGDSGRVMDLLLQLRTSTADSSDIDSSVVGFSSRFNTLFATTGFDKVEVLSCHVDTVNFYVSAGYNYYSDYLGVVLVYSRSSYRLKSQLISGSEVVEIVVPFEDQIVIGGCSDGSLIVWDMSNLIHRVDGTDVILPANVKGVFDSDSNLDFHHLGQIVKLDCVPNLDVDLQPDTHLSTEVYCLDSDGVLTIWSLTATSTSDSSGVDSETYSVGASFGTRVRLVPISVFPHPVGMFEALEDGTFICVDNTAPHLSGMPQMRLRRVNRYQNEVYPYSYALEDHVASTVVSFDHRVCASRMTGSTEFVVGFPEGLVVLWEYASKSPLRKFFVPDTVACITYSPRLTGFREIWVTCPDALYRINIDGSGISGSYGCWDSDGAVVQEVELEDDYEAKEQPVGPRFRRAEGFQLASGAQCALVWIQQEPLESRVEMHFLNEEAAR